MKVRWFGIGLVAVLVACILFLKSHRLPPAVPTAPNQTPVVILVADFGEANDSNDACADIIRAVREASARGVRVTELPPDSKSELLRQHRVVIVPTVLFLDRSGAEVSRFEGESAATVKAIHTQLAGLAVSTK